MSEENANERKDEPVLLDLTDGEWMRLLDGMSEDSQLQTCCANVSALRDEFMAVVRGGRDSPLSPWQVHGLERAIGWVRDGHELTPLLEKVCKQLGIHPPGLKHEPLDME